MNSLKKLYILTDYVYYYILSADAVQSIHEVYDFHLITIIIIVIKSSEIWLLKKSSLQIINVVAFKIEEVLQEYKNLNWNC